MVFAERTASRAEQRERSTFVLLLVAVRYATQAGCVGFVRGFHHDLLGLIMTFNYGLGELNQRGSFQQHVDQCVHRYGHTL